ncbi:hypothetical protein ACJX0J_036219, partial [Zea mays]
MCWLQVLSLPQGPYSSYYFIVVHAIVIDYIVFLLDVILHKRWFMLINTTPVRTGKNMVMHNHELLEKLDNMGLNLLLAYPYRTHSWRYSDINTILTLQENIKYFFGEVYYYYNILRD